MTYKSNEDYSNFLDWAWNVEPAINEYHIPFEIEDDGDITLFRQGGDVFQSYVSKEHLYHPETHPLTVILFSLPYRFNTQQNRSPEGHWRRIARRRR